LKNKIFNFRRRTEVTGWEFTAVIVMKDDLVVYKLWSGMAAINAYIESKKPLGPQQNSEDILLGTVP
jgi:hypothetical protein